MKINFVKLYYLYIIALFIIPSYFAIRIGGSFLLNSHRIIEVGLIFFIFYSRNTGRTFNYSIKHCGLNGLLILYIFICSYTAIFNSSINSLLGPCVDIIAIFYISICAFNIGIDEKKLINIIKFCMTIVALACIFQYLTGINPFAFLDTCGEISIENSIRDGAVRCNGPYAHALVLDMIIIMVIPFLCVDIKKNSLYLYKNPIQLLLLTITVFFSGARSGIAIYLMELLIIMIISRKAVRGKTCIYTLTVLIIIALIIVTFIDTAIVQYFIRYLCYVIDEIFGTDFALNFGGNISIRDSSNAREVLWGIISSNQFDKLIGKGTSYSLVFYIGHKLVVSIDNWYMLQYIYYALPGLFTMVFIFVIAIKKACSRYFSEKNCIYLAILISSIGYLCNLMVSAAFNTMTYFFIILAYLYANRTMIEE